MLLPVCYCRPVHCYLAVFGLCVDAAFLLPDLGWPDFISSTTWRLRLLRGVIFDHTVCSFIWCHPEVNFKRPRVLSMLPSSCQDHKTRFCHFFLFLSLISKTLYWYFCLTFIILSQVNIYLNCGFVCLVVTLSVFFFYSCVTQCEHLRMFCSRLCIWCLCVAMSDCVTSFFGSHYGSCAF